MIPILALASMLAGMAFMGFQEVSADADEGSAPDAAPPGPAAESSMDLLAMDDTLPDDPAEDAWADLLSDEDPLAADPAFDPLAPEAAGGGDAGADGPLLLAADMLVSDGSDPDPDAAEGEADAQGAPATATTAQEEGDAPEPIYATVSAEWPTEGAAMQAEGDAAGDAAPDDAAAPEDPASEDTLLEETGLDDPAPDMPLQGDLFDRILTGGDADDVLEAGDNTDTLLDGGAGDDRLIGGSGDDHLIGGAGDDSLRATEGNNVMEGGAGSDILIGVEADYDAATNLHSLLTPPGGGGADVMDGGDGDDVLRMGHGDIGTGGSGDDLFVVQADGTAEGDAVPTITDFDPSGDQLVLAVPFTTEQIIAAWPDTPEHDAEVSAQDFEDGTGATILVNGQPVAHVVGAQGIDVSTIKLLGDDMVGADLRDLDNMGDQEKWWTGIENDAAAQRLLDGPSA